MKGGIKIPNGADLKSETYRVPGNYYCDTNTVANTLINCPVYQAFSLKVELGNGNDYPKQTFREYSSQKIVTRTFNPYDNTWTDDVSYVRSSDLALKNSIAAPVSNPNWSLNFARVFQIGKIVTVKIDARSITANNAWDIVANNLPIPPVGFFFQRFDGDTGAYKIQDGTNGNLLLSNRSSKTGLYVDDAITYIAQ